jgi:exodeoxyribonuclease VII small subunit
MTEINYTDAFDELQEIVSDMEDGQINVDELAQKVKRATELIRICKSKLTATEGDVQKILKELEAQNTEDNSNF